MCVALSDYMLGGTFVINWSVLVELFDATFRYMSSVFEYFG